MISAFRPEQLRSFSEHLQMRCFERVLHFRSPAKTSRGALTERRIIIIAAGTPAGTGYGECCAMPGLLPEPTLPEVQHWCNKAELAHGLPHELAPSPIQFGLECALTAALRPGSPRWDSAFSSGRQGIPIHHLIWMANTETMLQKMREGIRAGFRCLKLKIGALPFAQELSMLQQAHAAFPEAEIRVDANGAFSPHEARAILPQLADAGVHSIEQPIATGQWAELASLCKDSPLPIALDEELIFNASSTTARARMLDAVCPHALVIKPSLHGGLAAAQDWAQLAQERNIHWWINSALESNIGRTALAEWCGSVAPGKLQALGTGALFTDDPPGNLRLEGNSLFYRVSS